MLGRQRIFVNRVSRDDLPRLNPNNNGISFDVSLS